MPQEPSCGPQPQYWIKFLDPWMGTVQEPPTRTTCLKSTGGTPPICTAIRPPFVTLCLAGFKALEKGKRRNTPQICTGDTPPICTAARLPCIPAILLRKYTRIGRTRLFPTPALDKIGFSCTHGWGGGGWAFSQTFPSALLIHEDRHLAVASHPWNQRLRDGFAEFPEAHQTRPE